MYTVLRESPRGAKLITDGVRQCWIQGRWMRPDGTLTPMGMANFANARLNSEVEAEERERENARIAYQKAREELREAERENITITVYAGVVCSVSDKAIKCWNGAWQMLYGKRVKAYVYLPKSLVTTEEVTDGTNLTMPKWLLKKNPWLKDHMC